jgi:hypothetical protein
MIANIIPHILLVRNGRHVCVHEYLGQVIDIPISFLLGLESVVNEHYRN